MKRLFVGDSITDFWLPHDNPWVQGQKFDGAVWDATFSTPGSANYALNVGISGDRTEHVLYRLLPLSEADKNRDIVRPVNARLRAVAESQPGDSAVVLDLYPSFVDASGAQLGRFFNAGIYPNEAGYRVWRGRPLEALDAARGIERAPRPCST